MKLSRLAKAFFKALEKEMGPFDSPFKHHLWPFDSGGNLNFLTIGRGALFVTYVTWDLFGHPDQKRGPLGRYELLAVCDDEKWCHDILTNIGRQGLQELFAPGETLDIGAWVGPDAPLQGMIFEEAFSIRLSWFLKKEPAGLLRCIGVTRKELEYAMTHGTASLVTRLKAAAIYPKTIVNRASINLDTG